MLNLLPWQVQLMVPSETLATGHCACVQMFEKPLNSPCLGWVTTISSSLKILPPPTGMSAVLASSCPGEACEESLSSPDPPQPTVSAAAPAPPAARRMVRRVGLSVMSSLRRCVRTRGLRSAG
ncbi:hypothetical protein SALBM311S_01764 [Streptomyces alboniger]